jgi:hypothetical protein
MALCFEYGGKSKTENLKNKKSFHIFHNRSVANPEAVF